MASIDKLVRIILKLEDRTSNELKKTSSELEKLGKNLQSVGQKMTTMVTLPIVAAGAAAIKTAMDFESAFVGVTKTVDGTAEELAVLEQGLRELAVSADSNVSSLNNAYVELAKIAEIGGQLGVAKEDLLEFTEVMGELAMTTNIVGEDGAKALARFANASGFALRDVRKLGDVIVDLGNNFATTESEILTFGQRLATLSQFGVAAEDILAFGTAMSSMGINAEEGSTSFVMGINKIATSVATGGAELERIAEIAGQTGTQFQKAFSDDATGAIEDFIIGLSNLSPAEQIQALEDLGLNGERVQRIFRTLASDTSILTDALETAGVAIQGNGALAEEAAKRAATAQANWNRFMNALKELGATFGAEILPAFTQLITGLTEVILWFSKLPSPVKQAILVFAGLLAAIGPIVSVVGSLMTAWSGVAAVFGALGGIIPTIMGAFAGLTSLLGGVIGAFTTLGGILITFAAPILIAIAAIAALIAIIAILWANREKIAEWAQKAWEGMQKFGEAVKVGFEKTVEFTGDGLAAWEGNFKMMGVIAQKSGQSIGESFQKIAHNVIESFKKVAPVMLDIGKAILQGLIDGVKSKIDGFIKMVVDLANKVAESVKSALKIKSPSQVFAGIGENVVAGFNKGIANMGGLGVNVNGTTLGGGSNPSLATAGTVGGGNIFIQNLNVPPGTTRQQVDAIMEEMARRVNRKKKR